MNYLYAVLLSVFLFGEATAAVAKPPIQEAAPAIIFDFCAPLVGGAGAFAGDPILERLGLAQSSQPPREPDQRTYALATAEDIEVEVTVLSGQSGCVLHYVGPSVGIDAVAAEFEQEHWESRAGLGGRVWRKGQLLGVTAWAQESKDGPFEGWAYVVRAGDPLGQELAQWFAP
ncbi:MAG: hypothetical protein HY859_07265 [Caulobacterales bacterium]|nr:hypothetical protein [Caulobacterales bacterium]